MWTQKIPPNVLQPIFKQIRLNYDYYVTRNFWIVDTTSILEITRNDEAGNPRNAFLLIFTWFGVIISFLGCLRSISATCYKHFPKDGFHVVVAIANSSDHCHQILGAPKRSKPNGLGRWCLICHGCCEAFNTAKSFPSDGLYSYG